MQMFSHFLIVVWSLFLFAGHSEAEDVVYAVDSTRSVVGFEL
jgi:hypothetical protein